ncbi:ShlB/FhaC/HecB family hemolysin secretion/activation protein [Azospirillum doebereinerae]
MTASIRPQFSAAVILALFTASAAAQDFERIAPKTPPANPPVQGLPAPPPQANPLPSGEQVILPALKGLVFLAESGQLRRDGAFAAGVDSRRVELLDTPGFQSLMAPYLGQPVTLDRLNEISRQTVIYFREHDHPLVDVVVPEQDISTGTVQIVALEFTAGTVQTEGNRWFSDGLLLDGVTTRPGDHILASRLLDDINWLNRNPFRRTDLVYQRSETPGRSDIVLRTADRFPLRVNGGFENTGSPSTERGRGFAGFNWGNAFWLDHQLSYQFTASPDFWRHRLNGVPDKPHSASHSGSYVAPLPWRHTLTLFGAYSESLPIVADGFHQLGRSAQASARYGVPLPTLAGVAQELQAGFDWKRTNNNLEFGGSRVSNTSADVAQWMAGYSGSRPDSWGATAVNATLFASPGGFNDKNTTAALQTQRAGTNARYDYGRIGLDRLTTLPESTSWLLRVQAQMASGALPASEQLGFGGATSVRGYDERVINGDQGILVTNELRTPEFSLAKALGERDLDDKLQILGFWDYGIANNRNPGTGERKVAYVSGVGLGFRYSVAAYLSLRFDYGWALIKAPEETGGRSRPHFGLTLAF